MEKCIKACKVADLKAALRALEAPINGLKSVLVERLMLLINNAFQNEDFDQYERIKEAASKYLPSGKYCLHSLNEIPIELSLEDCATSLLFPVVEMTLLPCPFQKVFATLSDAWLQLSPKYKRVTRKLTLTAPAVRKATEYFDF